MYICLCVVCVCKCTQMPEGGTRFSDVTGSCKLPNVASGNLIPGLWERRANSTTELSLQPPQQSLFRHMQSWGHIWMSLGNSNALSNKGPRCIFISMWLRQMGPKTQHTPVMAFQNISWFT